MPRANVAHLRACQAGYDHDLAHLAHVPRLRGGTDSGALPLISPPYGRGPPSVLPDISPSRGEIGSFAGSASSDIGESRSDIQSPP
ncbi:MAG: hypothetical protein E5Y14_00070 [Mesorhizobium sp.]|nr:MAG: hypothetical protein EOS00_22595 [Mesorhizobium sp.]TIN12224.1 MAG: hypothetical protein E5Y14_00070 [Mesorhizobium sp.]